MRNARAAPHAYEHMGSSVWGLGLFKVCDCLRTLLGLARTIYIRCIYGIFGREVTKYTVIYGVYIRFWPTLHIIKSLLPEHKMNC
jgi:hypothetical protein